MTSADEQITLRRLTAADLPLLASWLAEPHVERWWQHEYTEQAVERDFGPSVRGEEAGEDLVVELDGEPVGLVQRQRLHDYPTEVEELAPVVDVPMDAVSVDYLIGRPEHVGRGLGPRILRAVVADTWDRYPAAPAIIVPVVAANRRSWRALEKAGFRLIGSGEMPAENPLDQPWCHVLRIDRPLRFPLTGERLLVRPFADGDAAAMQGVYGDPDVMRHVAHGAPATPAQTAAMIEDYRRHQREHGFACWLVLDRATGQAVGDAGLVACADGAELGYTLRRDRWGRGLATEAGRLCVTAAFGPLRLPWLTGVVDPANPASARVLRALGFRFRRETVAYGRPHHEYLLTPADATAAAGRTASSSP